MSICIICEKSYEKGISVCCSRQCHNKRINKRSRNNDKLSLERNKRIIEYSANPSLCLNCTSPLTYDQYKNGNKFCSHSCNARLTNLIRDKTIYERRTLTLRTNLSTRPDTRGWEARWPMSRVYFRECLSCRKVFRSIRGQKYCNRDCKINTDIKSYRRACKFNITKTSHPDLFDMNLLEKHGWYRASNHVNGYNPNGATWDHLFRIEDGFKLKVLPSIMSHPANAQMVSWTENFSRKQSTITYEDLLDRIEKFGGPTRDRTEEPPKCKSGALPTELPAQKL